MQALGRKSELSIWRKVWRRVTADQRSKHSSAKTKRAKFESEEDFKTFARRHHRRRHNEYLKQQVAKGWEDAWDTPKGAARSRQADDMAASMPDEQLWLWMSQGSASARTGRQQRKAWRVWTKQFHDSESYADQYQTQQDHNSKKAGMNTQRESAWDSTWQHFKSSQHSSSYFWQASYDSSEKSDGDSQSSRSGKQQKHNAGRLSFPVQQQRCMQVLGIASTSALDSGLVKSAFLACAKKWHPDRHRDETKPAAEIKFKEAQTAYQHLLTYLH